MALRKQKFDPNDQHLMCSVFVMLFDKSRYLIELLTQNAAVQVPGGVRLVYQKGSLIPDENFSRMFLNVFVTEEKVPYIFTISTLIAGSRFTGGQ